MKFYLKLVQATREQIMSRNEYINNNKFLNPAVKFRYLTFFGSRNRFFKFSGEEKNDGSRFFAIFLSQSKINSLKKCYCVIYET